MASLGERNQGEGEFEESEGEETDQESTQTTPRKNLEGRRITKEGKQQPKEIELGKHTTLDRHTRKEGRILRNQSGTAPSKGYLLKKFLNDKDRFLELLRYGKC